MKKFSDFSITRKLLTAFLGMVIMMLVIGGHGYLRHGSDQPDGYIPLRRPDRPY